MYTRGIGLRNKKGPITGPFFIDRNAELKVLSRCIPAALGLLNSGSHSNHLLAYADIDYRGSHSQATC